MVKNKLKRFRENLTFPTLVQPALVYPPPMHHLRGNWDKSFFKNDHPLILELGCGRGEYTVALARKYPEKNFVGIDWKGARLWRGAKTALEENISNAGFLRIQIQDINAYFGPKEVDEIWITFPDPQPELSRAKKRLTSPRFLGHYRELMNTNGIIHLKTDSKLFYDYTMEVATQQGLKIISSTEDLYLTMAGDDILEVKTTYEKKWLAEGAKIFYLSFHINNEKERQS